MVSQPRASTTPPASLRLLRLSYVGFVSLGLPDTVLGAAWPALRTELGLPLDAAGLVLLLSSAGVVLSSSSSAYLRERVGTGAVLVGSTLLAAGALLGTACSQHWLHVLAAAFVAGLGGGAIDASLNDHVARHYSARHLSWLHACWGMGAGASPLFVASVLAAGATWRYAYAGLALVELLLSISFWRSARAWSVMSGRSGRAGPPQTDARLRGPMVASVLLFYVYGGLEVSTGLWTSSLLVETRGLSAASAGVVVGAFWGALTLGRILVGLRADTLGPARVLRAACFWALLATLVLALPGTPAWLASAAVVGLGLALAPVYPLAMHDTPSRFGEALAARLVGYQVGAATLGAATLPWALGAIAARSSLLLFPGLLAVLALLLSLLQRARRQT